LSATQAGPKGGPAESRRRPFAWIAVTGIAVLALSAAGIAAVKGAGRLVSKGGDVPTLRVEPATFSHRVPAEGNLRATRATAVAVPPGNQGPLRIAWLAPDGAVVQAGDPVVRFDPTDLQKSLRDAQDDLAKARFKTEKERAESAAAVAKLAADARVAELELDGVRRFQKKDETIYSRHERIESELDGSLAGARARHAREARAERERLSRADLDLLSIEDRKAGFKIDSAREGLTALAVTAPHAGIVVFRRDYKGTPPRVGDTVWGSQPLADLPDLARMEAEVYVLEADAGGLAVGKPATVEVESAPGVLYPAKIRRVDALAKPRLRGSPVQYFAVTLELARTDGLRMKPGARVQAVLDLDEVPAALAVPRQAVVVRGGRNVVYRREAEGFAPVPVTLGPAGLGRVVIASGLRPGDVIALADPEGDRSPGEPKGAAPAKASSPAVRVPPSTRALP
jgi:HlyD family secretion protein